MSTSSPSYAALAVVMLSMCALFLVSWLAVVVARVVDNVVQLRRLSNQQVPQVGSARAYVPASRGTLKASRAVSTSQPGTLPLVGLEDGIGVAVSDWSAGPSWEDKPGRDSDGIGLGRGSDDADDDAADRPAFTTVAARVNAVRASNLAVAGSGHRGSGTPPSSDSRPGFEVDNPLRGSSLKAWQ